MYHCSSYPSCYAVFSLAIKRLWLYHGCWWLRIAVKMWNTPTEVTSHLCVKYLRIQHIVPQLAKATDLYNTWMDPCKHLSCCSIWVFEPVVYEVSFSFLLAAQEVLWTPGMFDFYLYNVHTFCKSSHQRSSWAIWFDASQKSCGYNYER